MPSRSPAEASSSGSLRGSGGRRLHGWWRQSRWLVNGALWLLALYLGYAGFALHLPTVGKNPVDLDPLYSSLQLLVFETNDLVGPKSWQLDVARLLAPLVLGYTALLALPSIFYERLESIRLRFMGGHAVVCGLGRKGVLLSRALMEKGIPVVAIEVQDQPGEAGSFKEGGPLVLLGDATDPRTQKKAGVERATYLTAVTGSD